MNLFTTLSDVLGNGCTATITIAQKDGIMTVGVLPGNDLVKDAAKNSIVPLNISGTPEELDEGFVSAIAEPIKKTTGLLVDMAAYERAAEEAKAKSKMEEERKAAEKTRKEQYNGYVALAETNLKEQKYRDALKCVESARKVATDAEWPVLDALERKINETSGAGALFGPADDKSDGKNVTLTQAKGKKQAAPVNEDAEDNDDNDGEEVTVNLVGAGGTGSQVLSALARMDYALYKLGHPGLYVRVYDDDVVTDANIGRQLFRGADIGQNKANVLVTRINTFFGVDWEAVQERYGEKNSIANITITCVDNVASRITIGKWLRKQASGIDDTKAIYWLDFGNQLDRGQVVLGTIGKVKQPKSRKTKTEPALKCVDEMFDLTSVKDEDSGPSCSLAEALRKQDLFINSFLAQVGCDLLWKLIYNSSIDYQGAFVNLNTMNVNPIKL